MKLTGTLAVAGALTLSQAWAAPHSALQTAAPIPQPASVADVAGKEFDYVIIGGGTAGLTIASRLSEWSNITVAVLEIGKSHLNDEDVDMPGKMGYPLGNPDYDWSYQTSPQPHSYNLTYNWSRGKGLGGSSAINFMIANRGAKEEYDAWERLGNTGWNFETMLKYFKKSETFQPPVNMTFAKQWNQTFDVSSHGTTGALHTSFSPWQNASISTFFAAGDNFGLPPLNNDPYNGAPMGQYDTLDFARIEEERRVRSYSASEHWAPNAHRPNFIVVTNATVNKILFDQSSKSAADKDITATGAQLLGGQIVKAKKEVILCGGAIASPQILELSGVGNTTLLNKYNISTVLDLPGVGENLQDRPYSQQIFRMTPDAWVTADNATNSKQFTDSEADLWRAKKLSWWSFAPTWVAYISFRNVVSGDKLTALAAAQAKEPKRWPEVINRQFEIQQEWLSGVNSSASSIPAVELLFYPGVFPHNKDAFVEPDRNYMTVMSELQHPFFRGTIHINSTDVRKQPVIDPHYFEYEYDSQLVAYMSEATHSYAHTAPLGQTLDRDNSPNSTVKTHDQWIEFSKRYLFSSAHAVGTCALGKREWGGVLDPQLKVWGTTNLRIADASIYPLQVSSHPSMTVYAIAERAADIIKQTAIQKA